MIIVVINEILLFYYYILFIFYYNYYYYDDEMMKITPGQTRGPNVEDKIVRKGRCKHYLDI